MGGGRCGVMGGCGEIEGTVIRKRERQEDGGRGLQCGSDGPKD